MKRTDSECKVLNSAFELGEHLEAYVYAAQDRKLFESNPHMWYDDMSVPARKGNVCLNDLGLKYELPIPREINLAAHNDITRCRPGDMRDKLTDLVSRDHGNGPRLAFRFAYLAASHNRLLRMPYRKEPHEIELARLKKLLKTQCERLGLDVQTRPF